MSQSRSSSVCAQPSRGQRQAARRSGRSCHKAAVSTGSAASGSQALSGEIPSADRLQEEPTVGESAVEEPGMEEPGTEEPEMEEPGTSGTQVSSSPSGPPGPGESPTLPPPPLPPPLSPDTPSHPTARPQPSYPPTWGVAAPLTLAPISHAHPNPWSSPDLWFPTLSLSGCRDTAHSHEPLQGSKATGQGTHGHH